MNNKTYNLFVIAQLESLAALGVGVSGSEDVQDLIGNLIEEIQDSDNGSVNRANDDEPLYGDKSVRDILEEVGVESTVDFHESLNDEGLPVINPNQAVLFSEDAGLVGGFGVSAETGELVELPGTNEAIIEVNNQVKNLGEIYEEAVVEGLLNVSYLRNDHEELTDTQVKEIIASPISAGLRKFSKDLELIEIVEGSSKSEKIAVFNPKNAGNRNLDLAAIAFGLVSYRGTVVFPNLGAITASAEVNVEWAD